jgi:hypothetical protein
MTIEKQILQELGDDWDITNCQVCNARIVVQDAEMDYPICKDVSCVWAFLKVST